MRRCRLDPDAARRAAWALLAVALLAFAGCRFGVLGQHVRTLDANGYLRGTVSRPAGEPADPLVVLAVRAGDASGAAVDWVVLSRPGPYFLVVPVGEYRVGAFADRDHSLTLDPGEPVAWVQDGAAVAARPGATTAGLNLALTGAAPAAPMAVGLPARTSAGIDALPASRIGELTTVDDPRFSDASANIGLWRPVDFLVDVGAGIYFLEPFDPTRTLVLFVHGALGHPGNFRSLIAGLDRRRLQAWQGHPSAALGVARAPVPAPSYFDMAPGSPFLNQLLAAPLPAYAVHDLYFAYGGSRRRRAANDGVVTVASQLERRAQDQARRIAGFDAGHLAVLDDPAVADELRRGLAGLPEAP